MKKSNNLFLVSGTRKWRLIPFMVVGIFIFSQTSALELNYFLKSYLLIMEINIAFLCLYWLSLAKHKSDR